MNKGLVIVLSAPSGCGKGTILREILDQNEQIRLSVSATTRSPRPGEEDGKDYFFLDRKEFEEMIKNGEMLEHAEYAGNLYGTPKGPVDAWSEDGIDVILEIEVQGGSQVKEKLPDCVSIFILPPSFAELNRRLHKRGTETEEVIQRRLALAKAEMEHAEDYDYIVVNNDLKDAVEDVKRIIAAEKLRYSRCSDTVERVLIDAETV